MYAIYADDELLWFQGVDEEEYLLTGVTLSEEINKAGSLEFTMSKYNKFYSDLKRLKTTIVVKQDDEPIWCGRILQTEKDFYDSLKVYCEGQLSFLQDSIVRPYTGLVTPTQLFHDLLTQHNAQVPDNRKLYEGVAIVTDPTGQSNIGTSQYPTTFDELNEKLINRLGGYIISRWDTDEGKFLFDYLDYSNLLPSDQIIDFDTNLIDLKRQMNDEEIYTRLVPLGAKDQDGNYLTIKSVNNGLDYIQNDIGVSAFGVITKTHVWEDVTIASNLLTKANAYITDSAIGSSTLEVKAVDMYHLSGTDPHFKVGEKIRVLSKPHDLDTYFLCTAIKHDLENPANDDYTLGKTIYTITDGVN